MTVNLSSLTLKVRASPFGVVCIHARQKKRDVMRCWELRIPGCEMLWRELKIVRLNVSGTKGRGVPVDVSQTSWSVHMGMETLAKFSELSAVCIFCNFVMSG